MDDISIKLLIKKKNKAENSPKFGRGINLQTEEHEQTPKRINANKFMPRHIIVKLLKAKNEGKKNLENCEK